jgi:hypothetical protein
VDLDNRTAVKGGDVESVRMMAMDCRVELDIALSASLVMFTGVRLEQ